MNSSSINASNVSLRVQEEEKEQLHCECAKILIVDDDPFNIIALEGLLS